MDLRLHLLDSFTAQGSDGATYKVRAYERLAPDLSLGEGSDRWESTGVAEYRLEDGRVLSARPDGSWQLPSTGLVLRAPR
jgi:hypothetical protein